MVLIFHAIICGALATVVWQCVVRIKQHVYLLLGSSQCILLDSARMRARRIDGSIDDPSTTQCPFRNKVGPAKKNQPSQPPM